jgi:hypothetical protein
VRLKEPHKKRGSKSPTRGEAATAQNEVKLKAHKNNCGSKVPNRSEPQRAPKDPDSSRPPEGSRGYPEGFLSLLEAELASGNPPGCLPEATPVPGGLPEAARKPTAGLPEAFRMLARRFLEAPRKPPGAFLGPPQTPKPPGILPEASRRRSCRRASGGLLEAAPS